MMLFWTYCIMAGVAVVVIAIVIWKNID